MTKVMAGIRLYMAVENDADVKANASKYKFCDTAPLYKFIINNIYQSFNFISFIYVTANIYYTKHRSMPIEEVKEKSEQLLRQE